MYGFLPKLLINISNAIGSCRIKDKPNGIPGPGAILKSKMEAPSGLGGGGGAGKGQGEQEEEEAVKHGAVFLSKLVPVRRIRIGSLQR